MLILYHRTHLNDLILRASWPDLWLDKTHKGTYSTHIETYLDSFKVRSQSLSDVLFTKTQQKVLGLLFTRPDETFYLNEIVRLAGVGKGTIKRELDRMQAAGLLTVTPIGNQIHYQANKQSPIYSELLSIVRKTFGIVEVIKASLQQLDAQVDLAFIYGSVAKHEDTASSDVDLMVVTESLAYAELM